jgi:short-subunit dehydrogenase
MAAFQSDVVDFLQADLSEDDHVARVFRRESGAGFDIVVCCAAETGFGRDADRYTKVRIDVTKIMTVFIPILCV